MNKKAALKGQSITMSIVQTTFNQVQEYIKSEWSVIPLSQNNKVPLLEKWTERKVESCNPETEFSHSENIGIVLGDNSNGLVDVDLDCVVAVQLATYFLPDTNMIFGRESRPNSHYLFYANEQPKMAQYCHPRLGMILEVRRNGKQTMFPPSVHPSGERLSFSKNGVPSTVEIGVLEKAAAAIASASVILNKWNKGSRHNIALALSGWLAKSDFEFQDCSTLIRALCAVSGDNEVKDRIRAVEETYSNLGKGNTISGWKELVDLIGQEDAVLIEKWLFDTNKSSRVSNENSNTLEGQAKRFSDLGNADLFVNQHGGVVKYIRDLRSWAIWQGKKWEINAQMDVRKLAHETAKSIIDSPEARSNYEHMKWGKRSCSQSGITAMLNEAAPYLLMDQKEMDRDIWLLNCENGIVDLRTGEMRDHSPEHFITQILETKYDPSEQCPNFKNFLNQIFEDDSDVIQYVQKAIGYSVTGSTKEQCFFVAYGTGANGKSTLLETIEEVIGDYISTTPVSTLMADKNKGGIPNDIARLRGKRFVKASEGENHHHLSEALIKNLTGGDTVTARFLNAEYFSFKPTCKIWLATNHKPKITGDDAAIWRRVKLLPFEVTFAPDKQDRQLKEKLLSEKEGILAWIIEGARLWLETGLITPKKIDLATDAYRKDMDTIGLYIDECLSRVAGSKITKSDMYQCYKHWSEQNGYEVLNKNAFGAKLIARGFKGSKSGQLGHYWEGLELIKVDAMGFDI